MYSFAIKNGGEKFLESIRQLRDIKKREKEREREREREREKESGIWLERKKESERQRESGRESISPKLIVIGVSLWADRLGQSADKHHQHSTPPHL